MHYTSTKLHLNKNVAGLIFSSNVYDLLPRHNLEAVCTGASCDCRLSRIHESILTCIAGAVVAGSWNIAY